jgi:hypothetical protein
LLSNDQPTELIDSLAVVKRALSRRVFNLGKARREDLAGTWAEICALADHVFRYLLKESSPRENSALRCFSCDSIEIDFFSKIGYQSLLQAE